MNIFIFLLIYFCITTLNIDIINGGVKEVYTNLREKASCKHPTGTIPSVIKLNRNERKSEDVIKKRKKTNNPEIKPNISSKITPISEVILPPSQERSTLKITPEEKEAMEKKRKMIERMIADQEERKNFPKNKQTCENIHGWDGLEWLKRWLEKYGSKSTCIFVSNPDYLAKIFL
uniref:Uncharacterized protein n=1 Tax=Meloidogyne enterolobii TaxID=390850 RepID=A0A6V7TP84_MELEN|nr:unnamed protein product [Meloidogyne enterolobii]